MPSARDPDRVATGQRRGLVAEGLVVLGLSLGSSAAYAILRIIDRLTVNVPLNRQSSSLNNSVTPDRPWLDLAYQLANIGFALVPVVLALYLLGRIHPPSATLSPGRFIGLDSRRPGRDLAVGALLAALIGIPGLGLYLAARALGLNTQVAAANLSGAWWTVPVLLLAAAQNATLEEVVMVGYLFTRLRQVGWQVPVVIGASALVRGAYHLYQGFGGFAGNLAMGLVFGLVYRRTGRVGPLVVAHTVIDVVAFIGYTLAKDHVSWLR